MNSVLDDEIKKIFNYVEKRGAAGNKNYPTFIEEKIKKYIEKRSKYSKIIYFYDFLFKKRGDLKGKKYLFFSPLFWDLFDNKEHKKETLLLAQGIKDRLFAVKKRIDYLPFDKYRNKIYDLYLKKTDPETVNTIKALVDIMSKELGLLPPKIIVFNNNSEIYEKLVIIACQESQKSTISLQHGIWGSGLPQFMLENECQCEYCFVWGDYFKKILLEKQIHKSSKCIVLGMPYSIKKPKKGMVDAFSKKRINCVCFLGSTISDCPLKKNAINNIIKACKVLNLRFEYKPHPAVFKNKFPGEMEVLSTIDDHMILTKKNININQILKKNFLFLTFRSTSLIEAAVRGKLCAQILIEGDEEEDNFQSLGICHALENDYFKIKEFLSKAIAGAITPIHFNKKYINYTNDISDKFYNTLKNIPDK